MQKKDYYEILDVSKTATDEEIKRSFRLLAKKYHPDINKEPDAADKFKECQEAYAVLSDPGKRRQYDQFGHAAFDQTSGMGGGFSGFDFNDIDLGDIIGNVFGGSFGFGGGSRSRNRSERGSDRLVRINITFDEAVYGTKRDIEIDTTEACDECDGKGGFDEHACETCHGSGTVTSEQHTIFGAFMSKTTCSDCEGTGHTFERRCSNCRGTGKTKITKTLTVDVPEGIDSGNRLRLSGKGEAGSKGGPNGDLYIEFIVKPHELFQRDGNDIYMELPITLTEAILGGKKEVPTIYGSVKLNIPAGSSTGEKHRLRDKGVKDVDTHRKGDMYVILKVIIPSKLNRDQKKLIEVLSKTDLENDEIKKYNKYLKEHN